MLQARLCSATDWDLHFGDLHPTDHLDLPLLHAEPDRQAAGEDPDWPLPLSAGPGQPPRGANPGPGRARRDRGPLALAGQRVDPAGEVVANRHQGNPAGLWPPLATRVVQAAEPVEGLR